MRRLLQGIALALLLAACTPDGAPPSDAPPTSAVTTALDRHPRSQVATGGGRPASRVTSLGTADQSSVETRVADILSEFEARDTEAGTVLTVPENVLFEFDRAELRAEALAVLDRIGEVIAFYSASPVEIRGHTDARGTDAYNQELSERRAAAVRGYLVDTLGVDPTRITAAGLGESMPIAPNTNPDGSDNPAGRQLNRRVEIIVQT